MRGELRRHERGFRLVGLLRHGVQRAATSAVFVLWGCCATAFNVAFQSEVIRAVEADESAVAMSIFSGLFNFGIGAGSAVGGFVVTSLSVELLGVVGGAVGAVCPGCSTSVSGPVPRWAGSW